MDKREQKEIFGMGNVALIIIKWIALIMMVINAAYVVGMLVIVLIYRGSVPNTVLATLVEMMTDNAPSNTLNDIAIVGSRNVIVGTLCYNAARVIHYYIIYTLLKKFIVLFKSIMYGDMFTRKNITLLDESEVLSMILVFIKPVVMLLIIMSLHVFTNYSVMELEGVFFLGIVMLLKMIFLNGYNLHKEGADAIRINKDFKADLDEKEMELLKKDSQVRKLKEKQAELEEEIIKLKEKNKKKSAVKKTTKKTTKK